MSIQGCFGCNFLRWSACALSFCCVSGVRQPFFDYDCISVPSAAWDWNGFSVEAAISIEVARNQNTVPELPSLSGRLLLRSSSAALQECPLGVLYVAVIHFYTATGEDVLGQQVRNLTDSIIASVLASFPLHVICTSRWPIFEALELFATKAAPDPSLTCDNVRGVTDWRHLRNASSAWATAKRTKQAHERAFQDLVVAEVSQLIDKLPTAFEECFFGAAFVSAVLALDSVMRVSQHFSKFLGPLEDAIISAHASLVTSGWPVVSALAWLSDVNKGNLYVKRNYKYYRQFGDMDLRAEELSPMISPIGWRDTSVQEWRERGASRAVSLSRQPWLRFAHSVLKRSDTRPILRRALFAIVGVTVPGQIKANQSVKRGVGLMLLYGEKWTKLLGRMVRRLSQLGFAWPLLVVSIGETAARVCQQVARASTSLRVACWRPNTESQVHRFTISHILLHLGVDIFYFDMDIFFLQDPLPHVLAQGRQGFEAIFSSHGDADCINIGVFYLRVTPRTSVWFSQFLSWYHDHQYEIDQRGLDVFLGSPGRFEKSTLDVSFKPVDMVHIRGGVLESMNEFAIASVGWYGDLQRLVLFHWCNVELSVKWAELAQLYDASEALEGGLPLHLAIAVVNAAQTDFNTSSWSLVSRGRQLFDRYQLSELPEREACW
uniref:Nucleotide-diphospho-sugar transferase domain-containing protein n=1 Tax=Noctiluca scintillans TaxID=2966 RepID=A0A7S0ZWC4_NOCSC|mmetsp:Transcript_21707/g.57572  ORF Transcript_21707/g.57572 Transcript_21707/m.57572 type:complete len:661 (+) Transcript_21707:43-2025(+)